MSARTKRLLIRLAWALALLEVVYLIGANLFLNTELAPRLINRKPEKLMLAWERGWTVIPGVVSLRAVRLRGQNRTLQWYAEIDRARVVTRLLPLADKTFDASSARVAGLAMRLRPRLDAGGRFDPATAARVLAPIPGLANPPRVPPEVRYPPPPVDRKPWTVALDDIEVEGVREIWIGAQRYRGPGTLAGAFRFRVRGALEVPRARVALGPGRVDAGDRAVLDRLELELDGHLDPFEPRRRPGLGVLRQVSGTLDARAARASFGFLDLYLRQVPWLEVDGDGRLELALELERGVLAAGSRLRLADAEVQATFLDLVAAGGGELTATVPETETGVAGELVFGDFTVGRIGAAVPHVRGNGLTLRAQSPGRDFAAPAGGVTASLELPPSEIPDFAAYGAYLPAGAGVALRAGRGTVEGRLTLSTEPPSGSGRIDLVGKRVRLEVAGSEVVGDLALAVKLADADPAARRFALGGTTLEITGARGVGGDKDWWGHFDLRAGEVVWRQPLEIDATIAARMSDSSPGVALLTRRRRLLGWMKPLLVVEDLELDTRLRVLGDAVEIDDLELEGKGVEVWADLRIADRTPAGAVMIALGPLSAALALDGDERDWKLTRSKAWYRARTGHRAEKPL